MLLPMQPHREEQAQLAVWQAQQAAKLATIPPITHKSGFCFGFQVQKCRFKLEKRLNYLHSYSMTE